MKTPEDFRSPELLLAWADQDFEELANALSGYYADSPIEKFAEYDVAMGRMAFRVRITDPPPDICRKLAFHILCDLQHFFDQLAFSAYVAVKGELPTKRLYFPWADNPKKLESNLSSYPESLRDCFLEMEPYPTGEAWEGGDDLIYHLRKMVGPSKHQVTLTPTLAPSGVDFRTADGSSDFRVPFDGWDPENALFTLAYGPEEPPPEAPPKSISPFFDGNVGFKVTFGEVPEINQVQVLDALANFREYGRYCFERMMDRFR